MAFNLSKTIHQIPSEIKQDHLSKNYLHVVSSGKLDEKAEAERFNLIKSMGRRGTPNAVKNKWAPIQEQTTKDILNQSSSVDPNSLKARQSLEAFEARKKIFAEKQARENQIKLEKEKEMNKLREQRRMQRRSLYESDSSWRHGNSVSSGFDNNLDSKKVEINSMADKKNITDKGFERSHSVIDTISKLREKTTPDRFDKPVESFSYKNEKSITSATRADNQAITSHSISGSLTENRNRSSLSYKNKFNMFENNKDSYTGLKNLRNSSVNENYESPFKHRYSSGKSNNSCKSNVSNLTSKTNSTEDQSKENKVPSTQVTPEIPRPKNRASLITNAKEPLKIQDNNQAQNSVQPATASVNISSNQPDKSEASDDVFDQKPIEITETIDTRKNLNDVQHVVTKPLSHVISENNSQTGSVTSRSIEKEEMKEENTESMMQALDEFDLQQFEEIGLSETSRRMLMSRASQSGSVTK